MEENYRTRSNFHRYINIVKIKILGAPPTNQCRYDLRVNNFDIEMENVSIGISQDLMVDILVRNIRVRRTQTRYATYKDK